MNFHWAQSNKYLLIIVASAVALDGVLTTLVIHQRHDHSTAHGQVSLPAAPPGTRPKHPRTRPSGTTAGPRAAASHPPHPTPGRFSTSDHHPTPTGAYPPQTTNTAPSTNKPNTSTTRRACTTN